MTPASLRAGRVAFVLAATVAFAAPALAQDDAFRRGMSARGDRKWAEAAIAFRAAIAADSTESNRTVRGGGVLGTLNRDEYLPHFQLGYVLVMANDCSGALSAWEESERQGVARKIGTNARVIGDGYAKCEAQGFLPPPKFGEELRLARAAHVMATQVQGALVKELQTHPGARVDAAAQAAGRAQIATAGERLASGEKTRRAAELTEARSLSEAAVKQLQVLRGVVDQYAKAAAAFADRFKNVNGSLSSADNAARDLEAEFLSSPVPIGTKDPLNIERARATQLLSAARDRLSSAERTTSDAELGEVSKAIQEAVATLGKVRTDFVARTAQAAAQEISKLQVTGSAGFVRVDERIRSLRDSLAKQSDAAVSAELDKAEAAINRARRAFDAAVNGRDLRAVRVAAGAPTRFELQLDDLGKRLGINQPLVVPPTLLAAAQAQFQGRYAEVLTAMPVEGIDQVPIALRIHAHVIRAAALFAMYEVSGPRDETLRAQARAEAARAWDLDKAFQPNPSAFSPRFIRFYQAAAAAPPQ